MSKTKASFCVMIATLVTVMTLFFLPDSHEKTVMVTRVRTGTFTEYEMLDGVVGYTRAQVLVAPVSGLITEVLVQPGEFVRKGQLLMRLDTQAETVALAQLDLAQHSAESDFFIQHEMASDNDILDYLWQKTSAERSLLLSAIASKQIRALQDGVFDQWYVSAGKVVLANEMLGTIRGSESTLSAFWSGEDGMLPRVGSMALLCDQTGKAIGTAVLEQISVPSTNGLSAGAQQLSFAGADVDPNLLMQGNHFPLRVVTRRIENAALVPLACVDSNECIWIERNGFVVPVSVASALRNQEVFMVSSALMSENVVLYPDEAELTEGERICGVEIQ